MLISYQHGRTQKVADNGVQWGSWCQLSRLFYLPELYCCKLILISTPYSRLLILIFSPANHYLWRPAHTHGISSVSGHYSPLPNILSLSAPTVVPVPTWKPMWMNSPKSGSSLKTRPKRKRQPQPRLIPNRKPK